MHNDFIMILENILIFFFHTFVSKNKRLQCQGYIFLLYFCIYALSESSFVTVHDDCCFTWVSSMEVGIIHIYCVK
jgi:hypothetical protein